MRKLMLMVLAATLLSAGAATADTKLTELVNKADMALWGKSSASVFTMQVKTGSYNRSFTIVSWYDGHEPERTLVKILGPALWRGHGTLKVGSKLKLYNPRSNHVTVVGHSMLGDNWMGSHFTNDDLVKETRLARHYNHALSKKWSGKNEAGEAVTYYRVRLTPKPTAPVSWGKIVFEFWDRGGVVVPTRVAYYRKAGDRQPRRALTFDQVKKLGGREVPARMKMTVARKPGEYTAITYKKIKFDIKIPDSKFTEQALRH
jgi:outer membrane lipoprotein-sorting protein